MGKNKVKAIGKIRAAKGREIAICVFRAAYELGIRTVAMYSHEDRFALPRFKADEAYPIGKPGEPIRAYLDIDAIVQLALRYEVGAIHPGYGFLSENPMLARACQSAGIIFVGPKPQILEQLGDKVQARRIAQESDVPVLPGSDAPLNTNTEARTLARKLGYPVIVKAAMGGGGRGMRVPEAPERLDEALEQARRDAGAACRNPPGFLQK